MVTARDLVRSLPNVAGAAMVYFYFSYVDPWGVQPRPLEDLVVFVVVTATIVVTTFLSSLRLFRPLQECASACTGARIRARCPHSSAAAPSIARSSPPPSA